MPTKKKRIRTAPLEAELYQSIEREANALGLSLGAYVLKLIQAGREELRADALRQAFNLAA
jgi:hypothetical protein